MIFIGIDNGLDGAVCVLGNEKPLLLVMPTVKVGSRRQYDINRICEVLAPFSGLDAFAVLEKAQAMPKQGVASMFSLGMGYGVMQGILAALEISYEIVHPRTWQKVICRDIPGRPKERALIACKRLFPGLDLRATERAKRPHGGIVDALCLAEYGRRIYQGEG